MLTRMSGNPTATPEPGLVQRTERFFTTKVWLIDPGVLSRPRAFGYHVARVLYAGARTFFERDLPTRAAALTYYTVLSLVPFLAFAFAMVKGLGAYDQLVDKLILPRLHATFADNPQLIDAIDRVFAFVAGTEVTSLGVIGAAMLAYTSIGLMRNVGSGLNALWGAPDKPLLKAVTDYVAIIVLAPLALLVAGSLIAAATASSATAMTYLRDSLRLGFLIEGIMSLAPLLVAVLGLFLVYLILPNVKVRARSALVGAAVGGALWFGAHLLHVRSQMGVAGYNALYAGFSALPIFLVWVYVSWLTVLIGGGVAAAHQNTRLLVQQMRARGADERMREALAVNVMALLGRSFVHKAPRWTRETLAEKLNVSDQLIDEVLCSLELAGLAAKVSAAAQNTWVIGHDLDAIHVHDIVEAVAHRPCTAQVSVSLTEGLDPTIRAVLEKLDRELAASRHNLGLRELIVLSASASPQP